MTVDKAPVPARREVGWGGGVVPRGPSKWEAVR